MSAPRRGRITKAGNAHIRRQLVEYAWAYRYHPGLNRRTRQRQDGLPRDTLTRAWEAQLRLCSRFRRLASRKESGSVVATAIARELAGVLSIRLTRGGHNSEERGEGRSPTVRTAARARP